MAFADFAARPPRQSRDTKISNGNWSGWSWEAALFVFFKWMFNGFMVFYGVLCVFPNGMCLGCVWVLIIFVD